MMLSDGVRMEISRFSSFFAHDATVPGWGM
jgi:hypothetical protein